MFKNLKIGIKIFLILSFIAIMAIGIVGYISFQVGKSSLEEHAYSKLRAVREIKKNQLLDYFKIMEVELKVLRDDYYVNNAFQKFNRQFVLSGKTVLTPEWENLASACDKKMKKFLDHFGWHDVFLINLHGDILYTVARNSDLGMNITNSALNNTSLGKAFKAAKLERGDKVSTADFQSYSPSSDAPVAFMMTQMSDLRGEKNGYIVFKLPLNKINYIMQAKEGLGKTGETYLVGPDMRMRSDSFLDYEGRSVFASFAGTVAENGVDTEASRKALAGLSGEEVIEDYRGIPVLSAYTSLDIGGFRWALIAEIDEAEAFEEIGFFRNRLILWFSIIILITIIVAYYFEKTITLPIKDLTDKARELAKGSLNVSIKAHSQDEIGVLASSFQYMQKSVKNLVGELERINDSLRTEIRERKKIEKALEIERQKLFSVLDDLPASVHLQAPDYTIHFANRYFRERFGNPEGSFCYKSLHNQDQPCDVCPSAEIFRTKIPSVYEDTHKDGKIYRIYNYPHTETDGSQMVLQLGIDITAQKQFEKQLIKTEKLMTVAEISAMISHEFRNSLTSVRMIVELQLESSNLNESEFNSLNVALSSINQMENLVTQLLNFSRPTPMILKSQNLNTIIDESIAFSDLSLKKNRVKLKKSLDPSIPLLELDHVQIKETIVNLILNSLQSITMKESKFTNGFIEITTERHFLQDTLQDHDVIDLNKQIEREYHKEQQLHLVLKKGTECVLIQVKDNGIGIKGADLKRIFDPFFTTKTRGGTGLGLSMVKRTINTHGGIITVKSKSGKGTVFSIYLPIKKLRKNNGSD